MTTLQAPAPAAPAAVPSLPVRVAVFGYGLASYAVGMAGLCSLIAASLGLIPFACGGMFTVGSTVAAIAIDAGLILAFAVQHVVMARPWFKKLWCQVLPEATERPTFVLLSGVLMGAIIAFWQPMPALVWHVTNPLFASLLIGVAIVGWGYMLIASFAIDHFELFGIRQVYDHLLGRPQAAPSLVQRLQYKFDRHPIMTGVLLGLWSTPAMGVDRLALALGLTAYMVFGVAIEERTLIHKHGDSYREYRRRVRSVVPRLPGLN